MTQGFFQVFANRCKLYKGGQLFNIISQSGSVSTNEHLTCVVDTGVRSYSVLIKLIR